MTRFTYHPSRLERLRAGAPKLALDARTGPPLAVVLGTLLLLTTLWLVQAQRLAELDRSLALLDAQLRQAQQTASAVARLSGEIARMQRTRDVVLGYRRQSTLTENLIARLGNDLPSHTWLTAVQPTVAGTWSISGRSTRLDEVGDVLAALQRSDRSSEPRLVSAASSARGSLVDFSIAWETAK